MVVNFLILAINEAKNYKKCKRCHLKKGDAVIYFKKAVIAFSVFYWIVLNAGKVSQEAELHFNDAVEHPNVSANFHIDGFSKNYSVADQTLQIIYSGTLKNNIKIPCIIHWAMSSIRAENGARVQGKNAFTCPKDQPFTLKALGASSIGIELENIKKLGIIGKQKSKIHIRGEADEQYVKIKDEAEYYGAMCSARYSVVQAKGKACFSVLTYYDKSANDAIPAGTKEPTFCGVLVSMCDSVQGTVKGNVQALKGNLEGRSHLTLAGAVKIETIEQSKKAKYIKK